MESAERNEEFLTALVKLRLKPSEKERIREDAELAGLTVSELMRRRALGRTVLAASDMNLIRELRRLGGLLKHVHLESRGAYSRDTAEGIARIGAFIDWLSAEPPTPSQAP